MTDYWCDTCNDTTVVKLAGNGYRACVTCDRQCSHIKDVITNLRHMVTDLRGACEQKQEIIESNDGLVSDYLDLEKRMAVQESAVACVHKDLLLRAENIGGDKVVPVGGSCWIQLSNALKDQSHAKSTEGSTQ